MIGRMATETELKFRIPPARLAALRRAVATASARVLPLAAAYLDTPGEHLARARCALRLRREGDAWVQTLKAEGAGTLQRLEHNVPLAGAGRPVVDIARHDGTPAGARLRALLAAAGPGQPLTERYATRVQRTHRLLRSGGALVELALDEGEVRSGARSLALCEIEFELVDGPPAALLALAGRWAGRHGLLLDTRSKSELGHTLAAGLPGSPPTPARALRRTAGHADPGALLAQALRPVLANASQLAAGPSQAGHLRQLRAGLRRLRRLLRWGAAGDGARLLPALDALEDALAAAAARTAPPSADAWQRPAAVAAVLAQPATQRLWLELLALGLPRT
jgi:triphosphatase